MEKSDLKELRKALRQDGGCISWVYGLYVDPDNNPCWEDVVRLADMEDAERFRHISLFSRILSVKLMKDSFPVPLEAQQDDLLSLRSAPGRDVSEFEAFRDRLLDSFSHTDPYYATLARVIYDVPQRSTDGARLEDGDRVYEALLFAVSPASLTKPALGFDAERVAELGRRWQIGNPSGGFLYPAFSDRGEDRNQLLIHSKTPESEDYLRSFFAVSDEAQPVGMKAQKEIFTSLVDRLDMNLESAASFTENVARKASEADVTFLAKEDVRKLAEEAGVGTEDLDEIYEDVVGDVPLGAAAVADSYVTVKTDTVYLRIPAESAQLIETRQIDGRDYILIPADGAVTVNGASVTAGRSQ